MDVTNSWAIDLITYVREIGENLHNRTFFLNVLLNVIIILNCFNETLLYVMLCIFGAMNFIYRQKYIYRQKGKLCG